MATEGNSPPPLMFLAEAPEVHFEQRERGSAFAGWWGRVGPALTVLVMLALALLGCLLLGYAFGKTVLGA